MYALLRIPTCWLNWPLETPFSQDKNKHLDPISLLNSHQSLSTAVGACAADREATLSRGARPVNRGRVQAWREEGARERWCWNAQKPPMRSSQRVLGPQVDSEEQEQKLLMRRREVITERRCQLRGIGGDLFVTSQSYGMLWLITPSWQETWPAP